MSSNLKQRLFYSGHFLPFFKLAVNFAAALHLIPRPLTPGPNQPERFLVIHLAGHLGDAVMLLPMLEALRQAHPTARIECAVESAVAGLLLAATTIDHVHSFKLGSTPPTTRLLVLKRVLAITRLFWPLRHQFNPSTCILPRWGGDFFRSATLAYLTQAPRRIGFASDILVPTVSAVSERDTLLTHLVHGAVAMHEPARFVYLLDQSGLIPHGHLPTISTQSSPTLRHIADAQNWPTIAARLNLNPTEPFAIIATGASRPVRTWPAARWAQIMDHLHQKGLTVVILAGSSDAHLAAELHALTQSKPGKTILAAGQTSLPESVTLIAHADLFLGSDSGPGHIAGSLGIPSVILFIAAEGADPNHHAAPERVRPAGPHVLCLRPAQTILPCVDACSANHPHCILQIQPAQVIAAIDSFQL